MTKDNKETFILSEAQENYIRMYHEYFVLNWEWHEICKYHNCHKSTVSLGIKWVIENKLNIPTEHLLKGAIDAVSERLKKNKALHDAEYIKKKFRDNQFLISLNREIREDEKVLYNLQEIISRESGDKDDDKISTLDVLKLIKANTSEKK